MCSDGATYRLRGELRRRRARPGPACAICAASESNIERRDQTGRRLFAISAPRRIGERRARSRIPFYGRASDDRDSGVNNARAGGEKGAGPSFERPRTKAVGAGGEDAKTRARKNETA